MIKKSRIKNPPANQGRRVQSTDKEIGFLETNEYPVFCFNKIHPSWSINNLDKDEQAALAKRLFDLAQLKWNEIQYSQRHGFGTEKITAVRAQLPARVTEEVTLLAIRFHNNKPMVGYRHCCIFHILFIDYNFTLYDHG